jgi:hypothetical protein
VLKINKSNVDGLAEEHEGRSGRTTESPLVVVDAEQRERELHLVASPDTASDKVRVAESSQDGSDADHVEALVASEGQNDGSYGGGGRGGDVAEAEVLPEGVVAGNGAPEAANAGGDAEGGPVEALQDLGEDVGVVVDAELGLFLFFLCFLLLHGFGVAVQGLLC